MCTRIKNILLAHYRVPLKTFKFVPVVPKAHGRDNVCVHRLLSLLSRAIFKNVLGAFYRGWSAVVHPYSNFSLRCQMAPVQTIKFQTANFPIFCARIIVIFCTACIAMEVFSSVIMGNGKPILPVLHWLEVVIAFVSSLKWCLIQYLNAHGTDDTTSPEFGLFCLIRTIIEEYWAFY